MSRQLRELADLSCGHASRITSLVRMEFASALSSRYVYESLTDVVFKSTYQPASSTVLRVKSVSVLSACNAVKTLNAGHTSAKTGYG